MRKIERSAIVPFVPETMFDLVADVARYPEFLPGCTATRVHAASAGLASATMWLARGPLKLELRTRNTMIRPELLTMDLEQGPFSTLSGRWAFMPLGAAGTKVSLQLEFAFANRLADAMLGPILESLAGDLVAAFARRAHALQASTD